MFITVSIKCIENTNGDIINREMCHDGRKYPEYITFSYIDQQSQ